MAELKRTSLYPMHQKYGGKLVDFGGWELSVQFSGIIEEHQAVRNVAGLFDVSHMGEITVEGPDALALVQQLITNDAAKLAINQILYTPMCYENGTIVDDLLVYRLAEDRFFLVVNASNADKDFAWMQQVAKAFPRAQVKNVSGEWGQLALQGPKAEAILQPLVDVNLADIAYYWARPNTKVDGVPCLVSRTGYTGEDGFEIYCPWDAAPQLWETLLQAGSDAGLIPTGLGARDTLRFESKLPLYGHEIDDKTTPIEAGLGMFVKLDKPAFNGKDVLARQKAEGVTKKLVGFEMVERGIARGGYPIAKDGKEVGYVTTGSYAPTLEKNIGLGYVPPALAAVDTEFDVVIRGKGVKAKVIKTPFYKRAPVSK
ncbi:MAG: glycine cleavage system aminomethyltransferase GcvT [Symbiobacteriia bacterium]